MTAPVRRLRPIKVMSSPNAAPRALPTNQLPRQQQRSQTLPVIFIQRPLIESLKRKETSRRTKSGRLTSNFYKGNKFSMRVTFTVRMDVNILHLLERIFVTDVSIRTRQCIVRAIAVHQMKPSHWGKGGAFGPLVGGIRPKQMLSPKLLYCCRHRKPHLNNIAGPPSQYPEMDFPPSTSLQ